MIASLCYKRLPYKNRKKYHQGFTLVELILVIVLLGIVSAVALPKFFSRNSFDNRVFFDDTLNALRYAQKLAVATNCQTQFQSTSTSYQVMREDACASETFTNPVRHPASGELGYTGSQPGVNLTAATITFYPLGNASSTTTFTVGGRNITVVAETGFSYDSTP